MKAGIYLGKEQVEIRELPLPEVGDNDVLVQNLYSSICGTDVAVFTHGPNTGQTRVTRLQLVGSLVMKLFLAL